MGTFLKHSILLIKVFYSIILWLLFVHGKRKSTARVRVSSRRSHYTGVFKNGDNWQALISIQKRKTYIGIYASELEAAKAFDFYSILLNNITAIANFDYTKKDIIGMIENFVSNDGKYKPWIGYLLEFIHKIFNEFHLVSIRANIYTAFLIGQT